MLGGGRGRRPRRGRQPGRAGARRDARPRASARARSCSRSRSSSPRSRPSPRASPRPDGALALPRWSRWAALAAIAALLVVPIVAAGGHQQAPPVTGATNQRFASLGSNRYDYWRVAVDTGLDHPLAGVGASGFRQAWLRERDVDEVVRDAHSLELETFAELGLVGLALLATLLGAVAIGARAVHRADPVLAAGPIAALAVWAFHSAIDWDWEMPALTLVAVVLAGALLARAGEPGPQLGEQAALGAQDQRRRRPRRRARPPRRPGRRSASRPTARGVAPWRPRPPAAIGSAAPPTSAPSRTPGSSACT